MSTHQHEYAAQLTWEGNTGNGTASYQGYGRQYRVRIQGKPELSGSADPAFRGGGRFEAVVLCPNVTLDNPAHLELARQLHETAHELCFIASSCSVPIRHEATVRVAATA